MNKTKIIIDPHGRGIRFEHELALGTRVRDCQGREGVIIGPGIAGMPEVEFPDGSSEFCFPQGLEPITQQ